MKTKKENLELLRSIIRRRHSLSDRSNIITNFEFYTVEEKMHLFFNITTEDQEGFILKECKSKGTNEAETQLLLCKEMLVTILSSILLGEPS